jgi:hypothetical protein
LIAFVDGKTQSARAPYERLVLLVDYCSDAVDHLQARLSAGISANIGASHRVGQVVRFAKLREVPEATATVSAPNGPNKSIKAKH